MWYAWSTVWCNVSTISPVNLPDFIALCFCLSLDQQWWHGMISVTLVTGMWFAVSLILSVLTQRYPCMSHVSCSLFRYSFLRNLINDWCFFALLYCCDNACDPLVRLVLALGQMVSLFAAVDKWNFVLFIFCSIATQWKCCLSTTSAPFRLCIGVSQFTNWLCFWAYVTWRNASLKGLT